MGLRPYRPKPAEMQADRIRKAAPSDSHSPGWPHFDRFGNCLCEKKCCLSGGCVCKSGCSHQSHPARELVG